MASAESTTTGHKRAHGDAILFCEEPPKAKEAKPIVLKTYEPAYACNLTVRQEGIEGVIRTDKKAVHEMGSEFFIAMMEMGDVLEIPVGTFDDGDEMVRFFDEPDDFSSNDPKKTEEENFLRTAHIYNKLGFASWLEVLLGDCDTTDFSNEQLAEMATRYHNDHISKALARRLAGEDKVRPDMRDALLRGYRALFRDVKENTKTLREQLGLHRLECNQVECEEGCTGYTTTPEKHGVGSLDDITISTLSMSKMSRIKSFLSNLEDIVFE